MDELLGMGFDRVEAQKALDAAGGDTERAIEIILNPQPDPEPYQNTPQPYESYSESFHLEPLERGPMEPGIIISHRTAELGPLMTILHCNFWVQQQLSSATEHLEWTTDWWCADTKAQPQSIKQELTKQCAFVHMHCGRAQADSALLEKSLGNTQFRSLEALLERLEPINSVFKVADSYRIKVDDVYGDLTSHVDKMFVGQSLDLPPMLLLEIEQANMLRIQESWYPQRCTNELSELSSKAKMKLNDYDEQLSKIRRKRLELRAFKGSDVVEMLKAASKTMQEYKSETAAGTLEQLGDKLGSARNHLMDEQQTLGEEREQLADHYTKMDSRLFTKLGLDPIPIYNYHATGVLISSSEYYTRYDNQWFYVQDDRPSMCSFQTVRDACRDQSELLVVYSRTPIVDELEPSQAIREFCINEMDSMSLSSMSKSPTPDTSMSPSNRASASDSEESEMMDAIDRQTP